MLEQRLKQAPDQMSSARSGKDRAHLVRNDKGIIGDLNLVALQLRI